MDRWIWKWFLTFHMNFSMFINNGQRKTFLNRKSNATILKSPPQLDLDRLFRGANRMSCRGLMCFWPKPTIEEIQLASGCYLYAPNGMTSSKHSRATTDGNNTNAFDETVSQWSRESQLFNRKDTATNRQQPRRQATSSQYSHSRRDASLKWVDDVNVAKNSKEIRRWRL